MAKPKMETRIKSLIEGRVAQAQHPASAKKWGIELKPWMGMAKFFEEKELDVSFLEKIAIYAAQKARRFLMVGQGLSSKIDPYTAALLKSAVALKDQEIPFSGELQMATLCSAVEAERKLKLPTRLSYSKGTASTQASSTRQAMKALGMATVSKEGSEDILHVDFSHPFVQRILGAPVDDAGDEGEPAEA